MTEVTVPLLAEERSDDRTYAQAAAELGLKVSWLKANIGHLPHRKYGRFVRFTTADIEAIRAKFARNLAS